jgi:hypothetical protein
MAAGQGAVGGGVTLDIRPLAVPATNAEVAADRLARGLPD